MTENGRSIKKTVTPRLKRNLAESGRSMVEMLGVLAVVGVLSIGGIAGYRTAMDMHAANTIIDDVNKRAVMTATNIAGSGAKGKNESYYTDLGATNPLGKTVDIVSNGDGTFNVQVTGITTGVCKQIINRAWDIPMYIGANEVTSADDCTDNDNQLAFEFANDLGDGTTTTNNGNDTIILPTFDQSTYQTCESDTDCGDGICTYGRCIPKEEACDAWWFSTHSSDCATDEYCLNQKCMPANCISDAECTSETKPHCQQFQAELNADGIIETYSMCVECTENAHCGDGYFCGGGSGSCYQSSVNRCYRVELRPTSTGEASLTTDGKTYYLSKRRMYWWDAENFCQAIGKSLVPANVLNTKADGMTEDGDGTNKTTVVDALKAGFGLPEYFDVWTATDFGVSTSSSRTCNTYIVRLSNGNLYTDPRSSFTYYALCWGAATDGIPDFAIPEINATATVETATPETTN